ncbi:SIS domain-containing protein [Frateuria aurantia]
MQTGVNSFAASSRLDRLSASSEAEQLQRGYAHTLREILQQPETWGATARQLNDPDVCRLLDAIMQPAPNHIVLTGSGSSAYAGDTVAPLLQQTLGIPCQAIPAGLLLTHAAGTLPAGAGLLISLARSGDSPESTAVVEQVLQLAPAYRHLVVTCNAEGQLATRFGADSRVAVLLLDPRTHDRSLVMTSSFSNLVLGAGLLAGRLDPGAWITGIDHAASVAASLLQQADLLAAVAETAPPAMLYLGSGGGLGIARESALKMLEMTGGRVISTAETYLGLRHGPMSMLSRPSLVFAPLSVDARIRGYELDLLAELEGKPLGCQCLILAEERSSLLRTEKNQSLLLPGYGALNELGAQLVALVAAQLLALFRCLGDGEHPDQPSQGILTRVVGEFSLHGHQGG